MKRSVTIIFSVLCIPTDWAVRPDTDGPRAKPRTNASAPRWRNIVVGSAAKSLTFSRARCGAGPIMIARRLSYSCEALSKASPLSIWPTNLGWIMRRCSIIGTQSKLRHYKKKTAPLTDPVTESDEMFQNAGEKGTPHGAPDDRPRRRANKRRGIGTLETDRPPIHGVVGRESGEVRIIVCDNTQQRTIQPRVEAATQPCAVVYTDESGAYSRLGATGRRHGTVCHSQGEYARDDDGDGQCEVHCNTLEGLWTGLRNFLRLFRGVHKKYLAQYVAMFEWAYNLKRVTADFLRLLMVPSYLPT